MSLWLLGARLGCVDVSTLLYSAGIPLPPQAQTHLEVIEGQLLCRVTVDGTSRKTSCSGMTLH